MFSKAATPPLLRSPGLPRFDGMSNLVQGTFYSTIRFVGAAGILGVPGQAPSLPPIATLTASRSDCSPAIR